jgi:hypothetical protein
VGNTHYCIGSVGGPHPFPMMVRDFQRIIGLEAREQVLEATGRLPDAVIACVGGGSNAMGIFHSYIPDEKVKLVGVEAAGNDGILDGDGTLQDPCPADQPCDVGIDNSAGHNRVTIRGGSVAGGRPLCGWAWLGDP